MWTGTIVRVQWPFSAYQKVCVVATTPRTSSVGTGLGQDYLKCKVAASNFISMVAAMVLFARVMAAVSHGEIL
jgi:hypothetical protein